MNRPEARNAMSDEMNAAMMATLEDFENDSEVRAVILTGSEGAFCAGGDVKGMANKKDDPKRTIDIAIHEQRITKEVPRVNCLKCLNLQLRQ